MRQNFDTLRDHPLTKSLYAPSLIYAFCQGLLIPVLPLYVREFDVGYLLVGLALAGIGIGQLLGDVPAGMLLRRFGTRGVMIIGVSGITLSIAALAWAPSIFVALILLVAAGLSTALYNISRHNYMAASITLTNRGRLMALYGGVRRIGRFAGPAVGGAVGHALGLRAPFLLYAALCVVALILVIRYVRVVDADVERHEAGQHLPLLKTLKANYRVLAAAGAGQLFAQVIRNGRDVIIPLYAADVIGLDVQDIGFIVSIAAAIEMTMFYPAGLIMDRLGRKYAIVPTFLVQAAGMLIVPLTGGFITLLFANSLMGFANGLSSGTMMTLGADLAPESTRGEFLGVWWLIGDVGFTGGPLLVGTIADVLALGPAAWAMAGAGLTAAAIFAFLVPETLAKETSVRAG